VKPLFPGFENNSDEATDMEIEGEQKELVLPEWPQQYLLPNDKINNKAAIIIALMREEKHVCLERKDISPKA
jgi:hypothetical protein